MSEAEGSALEVASERVPRLLASEVGAVLAEQEQEGLEVSSHFYPQP